MKPMLLYVHAMHRGADDAVKGDGNRWERESEKRTKRKNEKEKRTKREKERNKRKKRAREKHPVLLYNTTSITLLTLTLILYQYQVTMLPGIC